MKSSYSPSNSAANGMQTGPQPTQTFYDITYLPDPQFYSHGVSVNRPGRLVFTSGQVGVRQDGSFPEDYKDQVQLAFNNLATVLKAGGASMSDLTKLTFYCVDWNLEEAQKMMEPLFGFLWDTHGVVSRPLTTLVPVPKLAFPRAKFEVEAVAAVGGSTQPWINGNGRIVHPVAPMKTDVVVIGGGFSGLQAASDLQKAGLRCTLLEANSRIGGRSYSMRLKSGKGIVELGATWINKTTQPKIYGLAQKFGLDCLPQYEVGDTIWQSRDRSIFRTGREELPKPPNSRSEVDMPAFLGLLEKEQSEVDIVALRKPDRSADISVEDWIREQGFADWPADSMRHLCAALVGREAREVGLHYLMDYIKSGGGYFSLASEGEYGAQSLKIKQGTSAIATGLADEMHSGSILLDSPVAEIEQYNDTCTVRTKNGLAIQCDRVVLAIPTNTYDHIKFSPPLPPQKRALVSRTKPGIYAKFMLTYKKPWWKELNLVGTFQSFCGPINFSWETSDEDAEAYTLALFVHGDSATRLGKLSNLGKEEAIINHLAELIGPEHVHLAQDVLEINYKEWHDEEYTGGAPTSSMGPGMLPQYGHALRQQFHKLHFGGGETAYEWKGYLEGALLAGSRVAEEVVRVMKPQPKL